jgi:hypothetical protein
MVPLPCSVVPQAIIHPLVVGAVIVRRPPDKPDDCELCNSAASVLEILRRLPYSETTPSTKPGTKVTLLPSDVATWDAAGRPIA